MIKIAYCISAYKDPLHLKRLIGKLSTSYADFYIHIDKNVDIKEFMIIDTNRVTFVKRYRVSWGGFSQVLYQRCFLKTVIESGVQYDRVFILSGQDYPIMSNNAIIKELESNSMRQYIGGLNLSEGYQPPKALMKIEEWHNVLSLSHGPRLIRGLTCRLSLVASKILNTILRKKKYIVIHGKRYNIYFGSSYMCLTFDCAKYVYKEMIENRKLMRYLRYAYVAEELVIPTIVFNSEYKKYGNEVKGPYRGFPLELTPLTYFEYPVLVKVLKEDDVEKLINSSRMFGRKFVTGDSEKLMDKLDRIHETESANERPLDY